MCAIWSRRMCPIRARDALLVFCYRRENGSALAAALGGIDVLVFAGENRGELVQMRAEI